MINLFLDNNFISRGSHNLGQLAHRSQARTPDQNLVLGQVVADQEIIQVALEAYFLKQIPTYKQDIKQALINIRRTAYNLLNIIVKLCGLYSFSKIVYVSFDS